MFGTGGPTWRRWRAPFAASGPIWWSCPRPGQRFRGWLGTALNGLGYRSWVTTSPGEPEASGITVLAAAGLGEVTTTPVDPGSRLRWMRLEGGTLGEVEVIAVRTVTPVRGQTREWAAELGMLRAWCVEGSGAHIVIGDVNATLDHAPLRVALNGAQDVAADRGQGFVAT